MNVKRPLIGPELLDKLLDFLIEVEDCQINKHKTLEKAPVKKYFNNIDTDIIGGLFELLERDGLLKQQAENRASFIIVLDPSALAFKRLGAYQAKEDLLNKQLVLLNQQIEELQNKHVISSSANIVNTVSGLTNIIGQVFNKFG